MSTKPFTSNTPTRKANSKSAFGFVLGCVKRLVLTTKVADFADTYAPQNYYNIGKRSVDSAVATKAGVILEGGVVLQTWGPLLTNVYATSNFASVGDSSTKLSGVVTGTVSDKAECSGISVRVLDGNTGNTYVLTGYDARGNVVGTFQADAEPGCYADLSLSIRICSFRIAPRDQNRSNFAFEAVSVTFAPKWIGRVKSSCSALLKMSNVSSVANTGQISKIN